MSAESQFSWLREVIVPALFTIIGAVLGFIASQLREEWNARKAGKSFVRAIVMELNALGDQLDSSLQEVEGSRHRVEDRGVGPHFAAALRTSVFASQVGKLRDVDDPLMIEVVHFYSDLGTLQQIFITANDLGAEYNRSDVFSGQQDRVRPLLVSTLIELQLQISGFAKRLRGLAAKLRRAEQSEDKLKIWNLIEQKLDALADPHDHNH